MVYCISRAKVRNAGFTGKNQDGACILGSKRVMVPGSMVPKSPDYDNADLCFGMSERVFVCPVKKEARIPDKTGFF